MTLSSRHNVRHQHANCDLLQSPRLAGKQRYHASKHTSGCCTVPRKKYYSQKRTSDEESDDPEENTDEEEEGQGQTRVTGKRTSAFQRHNRDLAKRCRQRVPGSVDEFSDADNFPDETVVSRSENYSSHFS